MEVNGEPCTGEDVVSKLADGEMKDFPCWTCCGWLAFLGENPRMH